MNVDPASEGLGPSNQLPSESAASHSDHRAADTDSHGLGRFVEVSAAEALGGAENVRFTPWLARNIEILGDAIGLELHVLETGDADLIPGHHIEVQVGDYWLDIRALDSSGRIVAIENQYGFGDHKHLGQLITYASGVGADVLVWVAEQFSDAHLQSLRWLNERTDEHCGVFAIRARFLRIGAAPPAPAFELLVSPSEWARNQRRSTTSQRESWTKDRFLDAIVDAAERPRVIELFALLEATQTDRQRDVYWYGSYPGGSIFLHPHGVRYAPICLALNARGKVVVYGLWNNWRSVTAHAGFRHVAVVLGQDHTSGRAPSRALEGLDIAALWEASLASAAEVNAGTSGDTAGFDPTGPGGAASSDADAQPHNPT